MAVREKIRRCIERLVPRYSILPLALSVSVNAAVYYGSRMIAGGWPHSNIESALDRKIPFWAPSVAIYLGCYLFWIVNYLLIARQPKKEVCQFFSADILSRLICLLFFLAFPTTNTRPQVEPEGIWNRLVLFVYAVDAPDNLFPSVHCLVSWFCCIGLKGKPGIPAWYRRLSCVLAVLVCISVLTTKQHVIIDVAGGIALAEFCLWMGKKVGWKVLYNFMNP